MAEGADLSQEGTYKDPTVFSVAARLTLFAAIPVERVGARNVRIVVKVGSGGGVSEVAAEDEGESGPKFIKLRRFFEGADIEDFCLDLLVIAVAVICLVGSFKFVIGFVPKLQTL